MLLYAGGNFIQVLEGSEKDVNEIYQSIAADGRNTGNVIIEKEEINERTFADWSMGFKHLTQDNKDEIKGYTEFLVKEMTPDQIASQPSMIVDLLFTFKKNNA